MTQPSDQIKRETEEIVNDISIESVFDECDLHKILDKEKYNSLRDALSDTIKTVFNSALQRREERIAELESSIKVVSWTGTLGEAALEINKLQDLLQQKEAEISRLRLLEADRKEWQQIAITNREELQKKEARIKELEKHENFNYRQRRIYRITSA